MGNGLDLSLQTVLKIDPRDNVLVALRDLAAGEFVEFGGATYVLETNVPAKHKFAMREPQCGSAARSV